MTDLESITLAIGLFGLMGAGSIMGTATLLAPNMAYLELKDKYKGTKSAIKAALDFLWECGKIDAKDIYKIKNNKLSDEEFENKYPKLNNYLDLIKN